MTDEQTLAYLAGFFDGEGYVGFGTYQGKDGPRYRMRVNVAQQNPAPLERFQQRFGCGNITHWLNNYGNVQHQWTVAGDKAATVLEGLSPFLVGKREQALLAIEFQRQPWRTEFNKTAEQRSIDTQMVVEVARLKRVHRTKS